MDKKKNLAATTTDGSRTANIIITIIPLIVLALVAFLNLTYIFKRGLTTALCISLGISVACFLASHALIPVLSSYNLKAGLSGKDLNKPGAKEDKPDVPEALGLVPGIIFIIGVIFSQTLYGLSDRGLLVDYNAGLFSICFMIFLGFIDDVVELPWRYKLVLPSIASLPLLCAYAGGTHIIVPIQLRFLLGKIIDLGIFYQIYMGLLAVFCTNAINIYAGINGLEAGQSFIIAVAVAVHNIIELQGDQWRNHLFSLLLIGPFIGATLGLLRYNWFPSKVFVGDTFTYFAGMTFAVSGILGHFSKTLLLFFIPQIINFLYSLPQMLRLFGLTCPRHRLPRYNPQTQLLEAIPYHMNLVNLVLMITGPLSERGLCLLLMVFQVFSCLLGFLIRYYVSKFFY